MPADCPPVRYAMKSSCPSSSARWIALRSLTLARPMAEPRAGETRSSCSARPSASL